MEKGKNPLQLGKFHFLGQPPHIVIGFALALLSIIPIWLIPVAPLSDWPIHLAVAKEAQLILSGAVQNPNYYVDLGFLGYSFVHLMLAGLMAFLPWQAAGQVVLTLLFLLTPVCSLLFFRMLAPDREEWFVAGMLLNYTTFFYIGNIGYLFAVNFAFVFLASGILAAREGRGSLPLLAFSGALAHFSHAYVFFLASGFLLALFAFEKIFNGKSRGNFSAPLLMAMVALGAMGMLSNHQAQYDKTFANKVTLCSEQFGGERFDAKFKPGGEFAAVLVSGLENAFWPIAFMLSIFPLPNMILMGALAAFGAGLVILFLPDGNGFGKTIQGQIGGKIDGLDAFYLCAAVFFALHYILLPSCSSELVFCDLNARSLPFVFAFLILSVRGKKITDAVFVVLAALVVANILFQAQAFQNEVSNQEKIHSRLAEIANEIPAGGKVFTIPAQWNRPMSFSGYPPYASPHYHAFLLIENPGIYVSGLFTSHGMFVLRSRQNAYDEIVNYDPTVPISAALGKNGGICYNEVPKEYGYVIGPGMALAENK